MPFRKHPTYVRKARNGYQLQRGVPKDVQPVIGKTIWVEGAGSTYRVAQHLAHLVGVDPDDDACIHISHLKQTVYFRVPGTALAALLVALTSK